MQVRGDTDADVLTGKKVPLRQYRVSPDVSADDTSSLRRMPLLKTRLGVDIFSRAPVRGQL